MSADQLSDEVLQQFRVWEIYIPENYKVHFGEWNQFQEMVEQLIWEWKQVSDDRDTKQEEKQALQDKYDRLVEKVRDVQKDLELIEELDDSSDEEDATERVVSLRVLQSVNEDINKAIKAIDVAIEDEPVKVKRKKR